MFKTSNVTSPAWTANAVRSISLNKKKHNKNDKQSKPILFNPVRHNNLKSELHTSQMLYKVMNGLFI